MALLLLCVVWRVELPSPTPDLDADSIKLFSESLAGDPLPGDYPAQVRRAATAMRGGGFEPLDLDAGLRLDSDLWNFHTVFFLLPPICGSTIAALLRLCGHLLTKRGSESTTKWGYCEKKFSAETARASRGLNPRRIREIPLNSRCWLLRVLRVIGVELVICRNAKANGVGDCDAPLVCDLNKPGTVGNKTGRTAVLGAF